MTLWSETENRRYKSRIMYGSIKICMALGGREIPLQTGTNLTSSYKLIIQIFKIACCPYVKNKVPTSSQHCTCHASKVILALTKLWHDWIVWFGIRTRTIYPRFKSWAHTCKTTAKRILFALEVSRYVARSLRLLFVIKLCKDSDDWRQVLSWRRYQMETFSALLAICAVPGEFPAQRPVTRSFDVFFDLRLKKRLSKQSWGWWFETLLCTLWRHHNVYMRDRHSKGQCCGWLLQCIDNLVKRS